MNKNTHKKYLPVQMAHKLHSPPSVHFSWRMGRSQCLNALPASCSKTCGSLASDADYEYAGSHQDPLSRPPLPLWSMALLLFAERVETI